MCCVFLHFSLVQVQALAGRGKNKKQDSVPRSHKLVSTYLMVGFLVHDSVSRSTVFPTWRRRRGGGSNQSTAAEPDTWHFRDWHLVYKNAEGQPCASQRGFPSWVLTSCGLVRGISSKTTGDRIILHALPLVISSDCCCCCC